MNLKRKAKRALTNLLREKNYNNLPSLRSKFAAYLNFVYKNRRLPNLRKPKNLNDLICDLMMHNITLKHIELSDKIRFKEYVKREIGKDYVVPYDCIDNIDQYSFNAINYDYVLKLNNDSGGTWFIKKNLRPDTETINYIKQKLNTPSLYGILKGEWYYQFIKPKVFIEKNITESSNLADDYKCHCYMGKVLFIQYITGRGTSVPSEIIIDHFGNETSMRINDFPKAQLTQNCPLEEIVQIAEKVAKEFNYLRVDFYVQNSNIYLGEVTFHPFNGAIPGNFPENFMKYTQDL